jgi:hypothetical protein
MRGRAWLVVALLAGCGGGHSGSTADPLAPPPLTITERCHTGQLAARITSAAATITVFSLTDTADVACVLEGYVRLDLADGNGAVIDIQPSRLGDVPIRRLTITPGGSASFEVHSRPPSDGGPSCTLVTPAQVRITPPDETDALTVDSSAAPGIVGCNGQYGVTAMHTGA